MTLRIVAILAALAAFEVGVVYATRTPTLTRHDAKIRTFAALLHITEQAPDSTDATHARITVGSCRHLGSGYRCVGELAPVAFSGIGGNACIETVDVYRHTTRVREAACDVPTPPPIPVGG